MKATGAVSEGEGVVWARKRGRVGRGAQPSWRGYASALGRACMPKRPRPRPDALVPALLPWPPAPSPAPPARRPRPRPVALSPSSAYVFAEQAERVRVRHVHAVVEIAKEEAVLVAEERRAVAAAHKRHFVCANGGQHVCSSVKSSACGRIMPAWASNGPRLVATAGNSASRTIVAMSALRSFTLLCPAARWQFIKQKLECSTSTRTPIPPCSRTVP